MIRVALVEDHAALRTPLAFMINREPDMEIVGQADTVAEARRLLGVADVTIVDLSLPDGSGLGLISELRRANHQGYVLVLTGSDSKTDRARAIEAGAAAVLHKSVRTDDVIDAIRRVGRGEPLLSPNEVIDMVWFASQARERERSVSGRFSQLTPREREMLDALTRGLSDAEIAREFSLSRPTVQTHVQSILSKLAVSSRLQAAVLAIRHGMVQLD